MADNPMENDVPLVHPKVSDIKKKDSFAQRYMRDDSVKGDNITLDHCYSKNWNSQSDYSQAQTAKYITWLSNNESSAIPLEDDLIDVDSVDTVKESQFEMTTATNLMTECERHLGIVRAQANHSDEPIDRSDWSTTQNKLFNRVYKVLLAAKLSKLANSGSVNEPILRRLHADKSAKRIRSIFSGAGWDEELLSWLHSTCMYNLPSQMLPDYLEVLQTLKAKVPELIDRMITGSEHHKDMNSVSNEALDLLIKRPWDPITAMPSLAKLERLPKSPLLVVVPRFGETNPSGSSVKHHRHELWNTQLANMGQLILVPAPDVREKTDRWSQFDSMVAITKACITQAKETFPGKPIILFGWNFGALLAIYVSSMQRVNAVVALGYPLLGLNGLRGDADDVAIDSSTPVLFVVGEHSQTSPIDDMENMRERMRAENELIVVAGANHNLNVSFKTKKDRFLTQAIVDRCIQEQIRSYLERVLESPPQIARSPSLSTLERLKKKRSQVLNTPGRKIITTVKRVENANNIHLPKKRKSPSKESRAKKQAKMAALSANVQLHTEQEQLAAISSITAGSTSTDPLNLSSSSHGSLTALKPHRLQLPNLNVPSDSSLTSPVNKQEPQESSSLTGPPVTQFPGQVVEKKEAQNASALPAYIQLSGQQTGQGIAISMQKARELINMGLLRSCGRSKSTEGPATGNYDTTRHLLSLPPGSTIGFAPSGSLPLSRSTSVVEAPMNRPSHIKNLLSVDGRLVMPSSVKPNIAPRTASPVIAVPLEKEVLQQIPPSNPTPGQSLIRRSNPPTISSSTTCRQILAKPRENSLKKTISVILNSNSPSISTKSTTTTCNTSAVVINPNTRNYSNVAGVKDVASVSTSSQLKSASSTRQPLLYTTVGPRISVVNKDSTKTSLLGLETSELPRMATTMNTEKQRTAVNIPKSRVVRETTPEMRKSSPIPSLPDKKVTAASEVVQQSLISTPEASGQLSSIVEAADGTKSVDGVAAAVTKTDVVTSLAESQRSGIDCVDNPRMEVLSPGDSSTLSTNSNPCFIDGEVFPHIVDDTSIIAPSSSAFQNDADK